jgi:hypothetical protein
MSIVDISNPLNPVEIGHCETLGDVRNLAFKDNYCYGSNGNGGVYIFNISNYSSPFIADSIETAGPVWFVSVSGNNLLVSEYYYGIRIYNITNPLSPVEIGYYNTPGKACGAAFISDTIILADWDYMEILQFTPTIFNGNESFDLSPLSSVSFLCSPNPFNARMQLSFSLPVFQQVKLAIYNLQGREIQSIVNGHLSSGTHSVTWNAEGFTSGIYFVRLTAGEFNQTQKLVLVK